MVISTPRGRVWRSVEPWWEVCRSRDSIYMVSDRWEQKPQSQFQSFDNGCRHVRLGQVPTYVRSEASRPDGVEQEGNLGMGLPGNQPQTGRSAERQEKTIVSSLFDAGRAVSLRRWG